MGSCVPPHIWIRGGGGLHLPRSFSLPCFFIVLEFSVSLRRNHLFYTISIVMELLECLPFAFVIPMIYKSLHLEFL